MKDVLVDPRGDLHCPYCEGTHFDISARVGNGKLDGSVTVGVGLVLRMKCLACGEWSKGDDVQAMPPHAAMSTNGHRGPPRQDAGLEWAKREAARSEAEPEPMRRPEPPARRRAAWAAAAQQERARLRAGLASRPPDQRAADEGARGRREGALSPEERREYWKRMDAELEERQRQAREGRRAL
jgi:hypothetical protein